MKIIKKELIEQDDLNYYDLKIANTHNFVLSSGIVAHNCGTGVTFGLSKYFINRLPKLVTQKDKTGTVLTYIIEDTIEGWADAVEALLMCYFKNTPFTGRKIVFDYSRIRKKGTPLKTGGGKAPGHKGLKQSLEKIKSLLDHIIEDEGVKRLRPIHAYDILMHCSDAVLSGGIRRAACMAIFDKDDLEMLQAKTNFTVTSYRNFEKIKDTNFYDGFVFVNKKKYEVKLSEWEYENLKEKKEISWTHIEPQRARSNNSVLLLRGEVSKEEFADIVERTKQWGEPGFIWANHPHALCNPCSEILFIPITKDGRCGYQFCNLSTMNGAKIKTLEEWKEAAKRATILGTIQAAYTKFDYLSAASKELTEEEALLGVSVTGWFDNPSLLLNEENQYMIAKLCVKINKEWSEKLGINQAARITCVKPEGSSSLLLESSSGIHPHHAHEYFRRMQMNKIDPIYKLFKKNNPHMCEESVWSASKSDDVVTFPLTIPKEATVKNDLSAIQHLTYIKSTQINWVKAGSTEVNKKPIDHNVSCTVEVGQDEWDDVIKFIFDNQEYFTAVSLLSKTGDRDYVQAPLQRITDEDRPLWDELISKYKKVDYNELIENEDKTNVMETVACAGGACEVF